MKVIARATMSVYGLQGNRKFHWMGHRIDGLPDPEHASIISKYSDGSYGKPYGPTVFEELLEKLQARGVKPGTELKITVETIRPKKKTTRKSN